ncbi:hypothetical protein HYH03_014635 [Edaphochlamys debaryana]|uniref:Replication protein A subunit n=1 Tax=Edaphochlamys debaryana TaxID=47281 RepID=A0A835XMP9_9CHLO|nr:hypothetical protein HYH03_014635 [Edaphochlamys debaryana]|eukprot:KAG2486706.1 hypothetical protein HYH03_014635 [Edaphochlamys debaryana]
MATATLSAGDVSRIKSKEEFSNGVVLKVSDLQEAVGRKHKCFLSDGQASIKGVLASQFADLVESGELCNGCLVRIIAFVTNTVGSDDVLLATDLTVVAPPSAGSQDMDTDTALTAHNATPEAAKTAGKPSAPASAAKENSTPLPEHKGAKTPLPQSMTPTQTYGLTPTPTPSTFLKTAPTPPSLSVSERKNYHKIAQIHPYNSDWCIRAKLDRKGVLRSMTIKGADVKILSVDLVDETGAQVQGTFWRAAAERYSEQLQEGRVYVFNRFKVKPADKKYSSVKADYQIDFTDSTEVSEAADQGAASAMTAAVDLTPIDVLPRRVGSRAPVDVAGVILAVGPLASVKRKADNSELPRRDVTIGDSSLKSITLTLWGDMATTTSAQLEGQEGKAVLQVTHCRLSDYNGCSLSTLSKSVMTVNPEGPAAAAMMAWYTSAGVSPDRFTAVGQDMAAGRGGSQGGAGGVPARERFLTLQDVAGVTPDSLEGDKAVFQNVTACVAMVQSEQTMYYLANPENGRKVVDQGGGRFWSEADGRAIEKPEHRYVLGVKLADHTGEAVVQLFNKEAEAVMGMKADELAALKEAGGEGFAAALRTAQWKPWQVVVMSKAREYNGERRVRHTAHRVDPVDWAAEGMRLVSLIAKYGA